SAHGHEAPPKGTSTLAALRYSIWKCFFVGTFLLICIELYSWSLYMYTSLLYMYAVSCRVLRAAFISLSLSFISLIVHLIGCYSSYQVLIDLIIDLIILSPSPPR